MPNVRMYCTSSCPYCVMADRLLTRKGVPIHKIFVDHDPEQMQTMMEISGRRTVPQIFIDDKHIGGYDDLAALEAEGGLDPLLQPLGNDSSEC